LQIAQTPVKGVRVHRGNRSRYTQEMEVTRGPTIEASSGWITFAKKRMEDLGWDQQTLAQKAGVDDSTVTRFFNPPEGETHRSRAANRIADVLEIPRPYITISSVEEAEWHQLGRLALRLEKGRYRQLVENVKKAVGGAVTLEEADAALRNILKTND
jgi:transcriptional regulator with XRE-family HTH domain